MDDSRTPDFPAGPFVCSDARSPEVRGQLIGAIELAPTQLRKAVAGLNDAQLDTRYRNWTIRQIVHHVADSHVHSYVRFKWALTEDHPTIKAYEEADWVNTDDCRRGAVAPALALLDGLHSRWVQLLEIMKFDEFSRTFFHPQLSETVELWTALNYYPWHARHHTGQILWLRDAHGWDR